MSGSCFCCFACSDCLSSKTQRFCCGLHKDSVLTKRKNTLLNPAEEVFLSVNSEDHVLSEMMMSYTDVGYTAISSATQRVE